MNVDFDQMMRDQAALQLAIGGSRPSSRTSEEQMEYIREMSVAIMSELSEALTETGWKTWASSNHINREAFVAELIDMLQFWMNLCLVVNADAAEIRDKLRAKHNVNWKRLSEGYDGLNKCHRCRRALDDPAVKCSSLWCAAP